MSADDKAVPGSGADTHDSERRNFLEKATGVIAGAGVAAAAWPLVSSMNPAADVISKGTTEVELGGIPTGEARTVLWRGKPVFILHRTPGEIAEAAATLGSERDPQPDSERVQKPEWLVVVGVCTHLGCVPTRREKGWLCPCHGSVYDNSGRVIQGPAPLNLAVPAYRFLTADVIVIGKA